MKEKHRLKAEQLKLIQRHMPVILIGNLAVSAALVIMLFNFVTHTKLLGWIACIYVISAIRAIFHRRLKDSDIENNFARISFVFIAFSLLSGLLWGSAGILFFSPEQPLAMSFLALLLAGMTAGSVASTSAYPPIYFSYAIPTLLPLALLSFISEQDGMTAFGVLILLFLAINLVYCLNIYKTIIESLNLRFENVNLIDALKEQKEIAEQANIAKSKFLAAASHDLRQPLHAQGLYLDSLKSQITTEKGKLVYNKVLNTKQSLDQLFNGLLDISRLDAGVVEANLSVFDIKDILVDLKDEFIHQALQKNLQLNLDSVSTNVKCDKLLLQRIIRNLISNAIRYTDKGEINIVSNIDNNKVKIDIIDSGKGIPESEYENIFSEYHQLENPERDRNKGLGLGLAIVKRLSTLLDIDISVSSQENKGSIFSLRINTSDEKITEPCKSDPVIEQKSNISVLVIDDEIDILEGMKQILDSWNHQSILAESADQAIEKLLAKDRSPDIIIADYRLRENQTGVDAIDLVRDEFNLSIPGIIITGDTEAGRISDIKKSGYRLLHKPISSTELKLAIHQELG